MLDKEKISQDISQCMLRDRFDFSKRAKKISSISFDKNALTNLIEDIKKSKALCHSRLLKTHINYDANLPISEKIDAIKGLLQSHQVIVVGGETGSGKSTQLPKICLEIGLGQAGMIAHTQPRRIAARSISQRVSEELSVYPEFAAIDNLVACKVRFSDSVKENTQIKLMTDGMLLAEIEQDPFLEQYQCIIVDEVHERSLNIDFLLAYLKRLIRKRKDLNVILTSATVDLLKFSKHFDDAPILEIEGRSYPVEIQYWDEEEQKNGENETLTRAIETLLCHSTFKKDASDILVFLATEQEIRQQSQHLRKYFENSIDILPLYGRMPLAQQRKVFVKDGQKRRVLLATNVAETSVTVPNIGFVIDTGLARVSRYNSRTKVQQLPIEKISQSSAKQRAGRCGRIASGVCVRLYDEEDFLQRDEFTQPEIQRTNLASVLLRLKSLKLGEIEDFPLLDKPDQRLVKDALNLLHELKAIDSKGRLTVTGKGIAAFSIDPRFARMLVEANERHCLEILLIIVAGLSINDPRIRPHDFQKKSDEAHERYRDQKSDFYAYIRMWVVFEELRQDLSANQFRKYCEKHFLSWSNLREWRELHHQLVLQCRHAGFKVRSWSLGSSDLDDFLNTDNAEGADYSSIHKSILSGCLSHVAHLDEGFIYQGLHHRQVFIFPASYLAGRRNPWIMSSQLVETSRLYAHCCASIEGDWILELGEHVLKKHFFDAFWSKRHGCVQVYQQQSLSGLIVEVKKAVKVRSDNLRFIKENPQEIFIRGALIERRYLRAPDKVKQNWNYLDELMQEEQKTRLANLLPDESTLLGFYQSRIPESVYDVRGFEQWLKTQDASVLHLDDEVLSLKRLNEDAHELFPNYIAFDTLSIPCDYRFEAGSQWDGLNIRVAFEQLNQISVTRMDWLVPGMLSEKCLALLKSLPKALRKQCLPLIDTVDACLPFMSFAEGNLLDSLGKALHRTKGIQVSKQDFQLDQLEPYLKMHVMVVDENNKLLIQGDDLLNLKAEVRQRFSIVFSDIDSHSELAQDPLVLKLKEVQQQRYSRWEFGDLEEFIFVDRVLENKQCYQVKLFQALKDEKDSVSLAVFDSLEEAQHCHRKGQRRMMQLALSSFKNDFKKRLNKLDKRSIQLFSAGGSRDLFSDLFDGLVDTVFFTTSEKNLKSYRLVYKQSDFENCLKEKRSALFSSSESFVELLDAVAKLVFELRQSLSKPVSDLRRRHHGFIKDHLDTLIYSGFLSEMPMLILRRYPIYLHAMLIRLDRLQGNIERDEKNQKLMDEFRSRLSSIAVKQFAGVHEMELWNIRYLLEEFSITLFAQELKPASGVSNKVLDQALRLFDV